MKVSYDWLKEYYGESLPAVEEAANLLGKHAFEIEEVVISEQDPLMNIIDVDVLPNRSSDCLCHRGFAGEVSTIIGVRFTHEPLVSKPELPATDAIAVAIEDTDACPRFTATLIEGIEVKESPEWLKTRLEAIGQRPINNIVDATNYVMFAIGQPIHAYDAELFPQVDGQWKFHVRYAQAGELVSLIPEGGKEEDRVVECVGTELLIVDGSSDTPIGLAGVKGGRFAGVHEGTTKVIIEAAHFHPIITRKTARRLGIVIDASKRFENEPSRELPLYAQADIIKLITDIAGGEAKGTVDVYPTPMEQTAVTVHKHKVNALLGLELSLQTMIDIVTRLGATVTEHDDSFVAMDPFERTDLNIEEDYTEEIGRLHGYGNVTAIQPAPQPLTELNQRHYYSELIRHTLTELGFSEVITSSFRKKDKVQLKNALATDKSYLRSTLSRNLAEVLDKNAGFNDLLGTPDTRVFEIGTVFYKDGEYVTEHVSVALGVRLKQSGYTGKEDRPCDEALSAISKALGASFPAVAEVGQKTVAEDGLPYTYQQGIAELNLTKLLEQLPAPTAYAPVPHTDAISYQPFSTFPFVTRDIALWTTEGTTAENVELVLNEHAGDLRIRTTLFDEFSKDGRTSFAFRLVFQAPDRTLTDDEVNQVMEKINAAVAALQWEVR